MSDSICQCGAQASYPHDVDCPYPCYRDDGFAVSDWRRQRHCKRIVRLKLPLRDMRDYEEFHGSDRE